MISGKKRSHSNHLAMGLLLLFLASCSHTSQQVATKAAVTTLPAPSSSENKSSQTKLPSPIFQGLPAEEIAQAQASVKQHVLPHWPVIAERSSNVRSRVLASIRKLKAPELLQVVPVIESGYNPYALSYAGAMGLWQIMPRTGRGLGLSYQYDKDGRRDVEQSSDAAVRYLLQLHERFGNWPLAFAAYHLGPSAVSRRLRHQPWTPADGIKNMPVPSITRAYVSHLVGMAALVEMGSIEFPEAARTRTITLAPPVDLNQLAELSLLEPATLFQLNPGLNYAQYLKQPVTIHVPEEALERVRLAQEKMAPKYVSTEVHAGDSLWTLARRHNISINHLRQLNPGIKTTLSIGQRLKVPANQLARAKPLNNPLLSKGRRIRYKVRSGDTLWDIAKRFGTTAAAIARSNQMNANSLIRPGDTLWILARIRPS